MSTDARVGAEPLLGFADSLPAEAVDVAAPAATLDTPVERGAVC